MIQHVFSKRSDSTSVLKAGLSDPTCILEALPGKLALKRRDSGTLYISLLVVSLLKLANMTSSIFMSIQRQ